MDDHDGTYHLLFSHPEMVVQLLRGFVEEPWVDRLDFPRMERVNAKFHASGLERRDGDLIWRIPTREGGDLYLYLLLEFQSEPEPWMALRVYVYVGLLYQHLVRERRILPGGRLPPVFPIVLYNGDRRWRAATAIEELIGLSADSPLWPWQPRLRYHLVDEGSYPAKALAARESLTAVLFQLETCRGLDEALPLVDRLVDWFQRHPGQEGLRAAFAALVGRVLLANDPDGAGRAAIPPDLLEVRSMLATRVKAWQQALRLQGFEEGRREGLQEGRAAILLRLLERRFGPLPEVALQRIASADARTLEDWSLRLLDAASLDEVLG